MAAAFAGPFPLALEPMVFSGDVMLYRKWVKQFENIIEPTVKDNHLRLFYLEKYTAGEAREVIEGYLQVRRGMLEKMRKMENILTTQIFNRIPRKTRSKLYMQLSTEYVREFQNNALWERFSIFYEPFQFLIFVLDLMLSFLNESWSNKHIHTYMYIHTNIQTRPIVFTKRCTYVMITWIS